MWGAFIRGGAGFLAGMLLSSLLKIVIEPHILPILSNKLGSNSLLYNSLSGVITWMPLIVAVTIGLGLIARGVTENQLPG